MFYPLPMGTQHSSASPEILLNENDNAVMPFIHIYIYTHTCTIMHYNVCRNRSLGIMYVILSVHLLYTCITQYGNTVYIGIAMVYPHWKPYIRFFITFTFSLLPTGLLLT